MGKSDLSAFTMSAKVRKRIERDGLYAIVTGKQSPVSKIALVVGLIALLLAGALYLFGSAISDNLPGDLHYILGIIGIILTLYGLFKVLTSKSSLKHRAEGLQYLEYYYGRKAEDILKEIDEQVRKYPGNIPATQSNGYFTQNWYIAPNFQRFVNLSDIACVVGIMGTGTFIIPTHGKMIDEMFGGNPNWGKLFDIIETANPHLLSHDDYINLGGENIQIHTAMSKATSLTSAIKGKTNFGEDDIIKAIVAEFISRIEKGKNTAKEEF